MSQKKLDDTDEEEKHDVDNEQPSLSEGIFKRSDFAQTLTSLIGQIVKAKTRQGKTIEGYLTEFSAENGIVLTPIKTDERREFENMSGAVNLKPTDIASVSCVNVNVEEAAMNLSRQRFNEFDRFSKSISPEGEEIWKDENGWGNGLVEQNCVPEMKNDDGSEAMGLRVVQKNAIVDLCCGNPEERTSNLNPYAEPFFPCGINDYNMSGNVVLPSYVDVMPTKLSTVEAEDDVNYINQRTRSRYLDSSDHMDLASLAMDSIPAEDKYSPEKDQYSSYQLSAQDCQQYYPQLQYIQYFRRFY